MTRLSEESSSSQPHYYLGPFFIAPAGRPGPRGHCGGAAGSCGTAGSAPRPPRCLCAPASCCRPLGTALGKVGSAPPRVPGLLSCWEIAGWRGINGRQGGKNTKIDLKIRKNNKAWDGRQRGWHIGRAGGGTAVHGRSRWCHHRLQKANWAVLLRDSASPQGAGQGATGSRLVPSGTRLASFAW